MCDSAVCLFWTSVSIWKNKSSIWSRKLSFSPKSANFTDLLCSFRIQLLLFRRCWTDPDGDANIPPQKPILLQGHERSITQIKYNREGDLLFSVAKDTVSRSADQAFLHTNVFWDELNWGVSCDVNPWRWPMFGTRSMVRGLERITVTQELFGVSTVTVSFNKLHLWCLVETECLNTSV